MCRQWNLNPVPLGPLSNNLPDTRVPAEFHFKGHKTMNENVFLGLQRGQIEVSIFSDIQCPNYVLGIISSKPTVGICAKNHTESQDYWITHFIEF